MKKAVGEIVAMPRFDEEMDALVSALEARWSNGSRKLRGYPRDGEIKAVCAACGMERLEQVRHLVEGCGLGDLTLGELSRDAYCLRSTCGEALSFEDEGY
ncbi:hypothetical protein [Asticcacaulis biprosthecium]|nr:hypothetical protein [Asticcacaulis biprosthecium]